MEERHCSNLLTNPVGILFPARDRCIPHFYGDTDVGFLKYLKLRFPLHKETLESWIKILDDVTKASLLALLPLFLLSSQFSMEKFLGSVGLAVVAYFCQLSAELLRSKRSVLTKSDEE